MLKKLLVASGALCILTIPRVSSGAGQAAPLSMSFGQGAITIAGAVKNQPIYLFGLVREARPYITHIQPYEASLVDANGTGSVSYKYDNKNQHRSVWVAVDMGSGAATAAAPPGYPTNPITLSDKHLKKDAGGEVAQLSGDGTVVELVVIRPGVGVWGRTVPSGSTLDEGKEKNKVTISIFNLEARNGTTEPPPKKLKKGDVVFILDSYRAKYGLATVGN